MRVLIIGLEILAILVVTMLIMRTSRIRPGRTPSGRHRIARTPLRIRAELLALSVIALVTPRPTYARKAA